MYFFGLIPDVGVFLIGFRFLYFMVIITLYLVGPLVRGVGRVVLGV